jgi:hypothetical protein
LEVKSSPCSEGIPEKEDWSVVRGTFFESTSPVWDGQGGRDGRDGVEWCRKWPFVNSRGVERRTRARGRQKRMKAPMMATRRMSRWKTRVSGLSVDADDVVVVVVVAVTVLVPFLDSQPSLTKVGIGGPSRPDDAFASFLDPSMSVPGWPYLPSSSPSPSS